MPAYMFHCNNDACAKDGSPQVFTDNQDRNCGVCQKPLKHDGGIKQERERELVLELLLRTVVRNYYTEDAELTHCAIYEAREYLYGTVDDLAHEAIEAGKPMSQFLRELPDSAKMVKDDLKIYSNAYIAAQQRRHDLPHLYAQDKEE